jgi:hypothetical protein
MTNKITIILTTAAMAAAAAVYGDTVDYPLSFDITEYSYEEVVGGDEETYWLYEVEDGSVYAPAGEPTIPTRAYDVIIPFGSTNVSVEIINTSYHDEEGVENKLYPGQLPKKTNDGEEWEWTPPGDTYEESEYYPAEPLVAKGKGLWRGHFAVQACLCTMKYQPVEYHVQKLASATLRVTYTPPDPPPAAERWEWEHIYDKWSDYIKTIVLNPDDVYDYREPVNFVDVIGYYEYEEDGEIITVAYNQESEVFSSSVPVPGAEEWPEDQGYPYPYIIVTNDKAYYKDPPYEVNVNLTQEMDPLVTWKTDKGIPIKMYTVDDIKAHYTPEPGEYWDPQVAIRTLLKKAMEFWGTEYVALIGDVDHLTQPYSPDWGKYGVVPIRVLVSRDYPYMKHLESCEEVEVTVPEGWGDVVSSDLYYTDLDEPGGWDGDGDGVFGEPGPEHDNIKVFKPDVACGWIPATTQEELHSYIAKVLKYEKEPYLEKIGGYTYTRRFLHIATDDGLGETAQARKTPDFLPGFYIKKMYEAPQETGDGPGKWPTYPQPHDVNDALNEGYGLVEIDTHGHPYFHYIITQGNDQVETQIWASRRGLVHRYMSNMIFPSTVKDLYKARYGIIVSLSCKTNCFEYDGRDASDVISERYLFDDDGGGVAYLGDTRDGSWYTTAQITQEFYRVLLRKTEAPDDDCYFLGPAETWARALYFGKNPYAHYYVYQHMLCGEPELNVWTANEPKVLTFDSISTWHVPGEGYHVKVTVKEDDEPCYLARVCLNAGDKAYLLNLTRYSGKCEFIVSEAASNVHLTATKRNCVPAYKKDLNIP